EEQKKAEKLRRELTVRLEMADEKAKRDAQRILDDARRTAERTFDELDAMRKRQNKEQDHIRENEARAELRRQLNAADEKLAAVKKEARKQEKSARPVVVGDTVEILSMGVQATVLSISQDRVLELQAGILKTTAKEDEVLLLKDAPKQKPTGPKASAATLRREAVPSELDLRGMMTDEAVAVLERYIDNAVMAKLEKVTIIHGKGTGALRAAVQQSLKTNKCVKSFRLGVFGEGENGVTVVELK
ncbi:MAG: Smr/MutS family protein, partial [Oscillospiraceae bacterium]